MNKRQIIQFILLLSIAACSYSFISVTVPAPIAPNEVIVKAKKLPAEVLDLKNWKLNIPVKIQSLWSDEYKQPFLNTYTDSNWFHVNAAGDGVVFKAHAGGTTTKGSGYPRSELREMINDGAKNSSWSSSEGEHTMFMELSVTHLPVVKPHIVVGQIHDAVDDVIVFRLENKKLIVKIDDGKGPVLNANYQLGKRFTLMFKVRDNETECYYNGELKFKYKKTFQNSYFKAGAYVQSSCQGKKKVEGELCDSYGEMEIYQLWVKHNF